MVKKKKPIKAFAELEVSKDLSPQEVKKIFGPIARNKTITVKIHFI